MAAKTPDSIRKENLGSINLLIAVFVSENIDDNDTWASGIKNIISYQWQGISDAGYDLSITSVTAAGLFTFDAGSNTTGHLHVYYKDM